MGFFSNWKEKRERQKRIDALSEQEKENLRKVEREYYLGNAEDLVKQRGMINAEKDFQLPEGYEIEEEVEKENEGK